MARGFGRDKDTVTWFTQITLLIFIFASLRHFYI